MVSGLWGYAVPYPCYLAAADEQRGSLPGASLNLQTFPPKYRQDVGAERDIIEKPANLYQIMAFTLLRNKPSAGHACPAGSKNGVDVRNEELGLVAAVRTTKEHNTTDTVQHSCESRALGICDNKRLSRC